MKIKFIEDGVWCHPTLWLWRPMYIQDADIWPQVRQLLLLLVWGELTDCRSTLMMSRNLGASLYIYLHVKDVGTRMDLYITIKWGSAVLHTRPPFLTRPEGCEAITRAHFFFSILHLILLRIKLMPLNQWNEVNLFPMTAVRTDGERRYQMLMWYSLKVTFYMKKNPVREVFTFCAAALCRVVAFAELAVENCIINDWRQEVIGGHIYNNLFNQQRHRSHLRALLLKCWVLR